MDKSMGDGNLPSFYTKPSERTRNGRTSSDLTHIEFSDDQISAHSSRSDYFDPNPIRAGRPSELISRLFQRHTLDLSVLASSHPSSNFSFDCKSTSNGNLEASSSNNREESLNLIGNVNDDLLDTKFFHSFSEPIAGNDSDFIAGDAAIEIFEKDEEILRKETEFMIPSNPAAIEDDAGLGQSWMATSLSDVTRPSWLSPADDQTSRVSMGTLMRARTEPLGCLSGGDERPSFGLESAPSPRSFKPLSETCVGEEEIDCSSNENVVSSAAISMAIADVTESADPKSLVELLLKMDAATRSKPKTNNVESNRKVDTKKQSIMLNKRGEGTGASFSSKTELEKRAPSPRKEKWVILETVSNQGHKNVRTETIFEPSICQIPLPSPPQNDRPSSSSSSSSLTLKMLRSNVAGRLPTLEVSETVTFAGPICVGVTSETSLVIRNPTLHYVEFKTTLTSLCCDGRDRMDMREHSIPIFEANTDGMSIEPNLSNEIKIKLKPTDEGKWATRINVSCRFVETATSEWVSLPPVMIEAIAVSPKIQVVPGDVIDFGVLPEGALQTRSLRLVNKSIAKVPISLIIEGTASQRQGYYFISESSKSDGNQTVCSSILKFVLSESETFIINLRAPQISNYDGDTRFVRTNLRVELDTSRIDVVLFATLRLTAVVGAVRLFTIQDDDQINLQPSHELPIQNRGAIPFEVELSSLHPDLISVVPSSLCLRPQQQELLRIRYLSNDPYSPPFHSKLQVKVQPGGPVFEINVVGLSSTKAPTGNLLDVSVLQSDRHNLYWGTVRLNERVEKNIVFFNTSSSITLDLYFVVSENARKKNDLNDKPLPFQLVTRLSDGSVTSTRKTNVTINPMQKLPLTVVYVPNAVTGDYAQLVIKFGRRNELKLHTKFTIPLRGCGGGADVRWDGICETSSKEKRCDWHVDRRTANGEFHLLARNCGQRAAYIKVLPSHHPSIESASSLPNVSVRPSQFILQEGAIQSVTVICNSSSMASSFYLGLIIGDEILRQRFILFRSNVLSTEIDEMDQLLLKDSFVGESRLQPSMADSRWLPTKSDRRLLLSNMTTKWVAVLPTVFGTYEEEPSGIFRPLVPEHTFNETSTFMRHTVTSSPLDAAPISVDENSLQFRSTKCGECSSLKLSIRNMSLQNKEITVSNPLPPFYVNHKTLTVKCRHYLSLPVYFRPLKRGSHSSKIFLKMSNQMDLPIVLSGDAV